MHSQGLNINASFFSFTFPLNAFLKDSTEIYLTKGIMEKSYTLIEKKLH